MASEENVTCSRIRSLLSEFIDQALPAGDCEQVNAHLVACPACLRYFHSLQRVVELCHKSGQVESPPPLTLQERAELWAAYRHTLARCSQLIR
jgi:anti-sigma factor RsiW